MNTVLRKFGPLKLKVRWYSPTKPKWHDQLTLYKQCGSQQAAFGFHRRNFPTKLISLDIPAERLLAGFDRDTAYDVRRAERDGVVFELEEDRDKGVMFYDMFAASKGRKAMGHVLATYGDGLQIT